jgi:hypothetical protein
MKNHSIRHTISHFLSKCHQNLMYLTFFDVFADFSSQPVCGFECSTNQCDESRIIFTLVANHNAKSVVGLSGLALPSNYFDIFQLENGQQVLCRLPVRIIPAGFSTNQKIGAIVVLEY